MPFLKAPVSVFDPAVPFKLIPAAEPGIDSFFAPTLITSELYKRLPLLPEVARAELDLSSGMRIRVPEVEIGVKVGSIRIDRVRALVVDGGAHDILLGSDILEKVFTLGRSAERDQRASDDVHVSTGRKDDPSSLGLEIFPVQPPLALQKFEDLLKYQRWIYNILLVSSGEVKASRSNVTEVIESDAHIPDGLRLDLAWVDSGSIWLTLKSGSLKTLGYLASLFETGASAKLAQELAEAKSAETRADLDQGARDATIRRMNDEQEMLSAENVRKTYDSWRQEVRSRLSFFDELTNQLDDPQVVAELKRKKAAAIARIAEQELLPIVRNFPLPFEVGDKLLLPSPKK
jgi:hypothetical protein